MIALAGCGPTTSTSTRSPISIPARRKACSTGAAGAGIAASLFAIGGTQGDRWRIRLSRAATFQSLSMLAITAYLAVMAVLVTALRGSGVDWTRALLIALLAAMTVGGDRAAAVQPGARLGQGQDRQALLRASLRLSHRMASLHRNDRRNRRRKPPPLGQRVIKAFADILDAPGGTAAGCRRKWLDRAGRFLELVGDRKSWYCHPKRGGVGLLAVGWRRRPDH